MFHCCSPYLIKLAPGSPPRSDWTSTMRLHRIILISPFAAFVNSAEAQVLVIPYGDPGTNFEKYVIAAVTVAAVVFAVWYYWRR